MIIKSLKLEWWLSNLLNKNSAYQTFLIKMVIIQSSNLLNKNGDYQIFKTRMVIITTFKLDWWLSNL